MAEQDEAGPSAAFATSKYTQNIAGQAQPYSVAPGAKLASSIVAPSFRNRATAAFRVADFKRECAEFLLQMEALLQGIVTPEQPGAPGCALDVSDLRKRTWEEEAAEVQRMSIESPLEGLQQQQEQEQQQQEVQQVGEGQEQEQQLQNGVVSQQEDLQRLGNVQQALQQKQQLGEQEAVQSAQEQGELPQAVPPPPQQQNQAAGGVKAGAERQSVAAAQPSALAPGTMQGQQLQQQAGSEELAAGQQAGPSSQYQQQDLPQREEEHEAQSEQPETEHQEQQEQQRRGKRKRGRQRAKQRRQQQQAARPPAALAVHNPRPDAMRKLSAYEESIAVIRQRWQADNAAAAAALRSVREAREKQGKGAKGTQQARLREQQLARLGACLEEGQAAGAGPQDRVPPGEVVLCVRVGIPHFPQQMHEEYLVLGSQRLTELRDAIYCLSDINAKALEDEENAVRRQAGEPELSLVKQSAYLYVEGTFYNDLREGRLDYSAPMIQHNRQHSVPAPPHPLPGPASSRPLTTEFSTASMHDTRFEDLWLRVGDAAGNLYCHQGGCEHLVSFMDVRLHDPAADPPLLSHYPFKLSNSQHVVRRNCEVCGQRAAKRATYDDPATPHTPFFWCTDCFRLLHYGEQGQALYTDYRVFPYTHEYGTNQGGFSCPW